VSVKGISLTQCLRGARKWRAACVQLLTAT